MKRTILAVAAFLSVAGLAHAQSALQRGFQDPPPECRPEVFYQVLGGMQTKAALTKDFEALAREGIGGIMLMQMPDQLGGVVQWPFRDYPGKMTICSDKWFAQWNYAIGELDRLGLTFSTIPCPGWSHVGGPWVPASKSVKVLVGKSNSLKGPAHFKGLIARAPIAYEKKPILPPWASDAEAWQKKRESWGDYYRDAAVVAFPSGLGNDKPVPEASLIDLTRQMDADGRLTWDVPDGEWTVWRLGCAAFNGPNYPAPIEGAGLEVDRMDAQAPALVLDNYVGRLAREARAKGYKSFKGFDIDSYEAGRQDFSENFIGQFKRRMGYDCTTWLPAWLDRKRVVGSAELTARFRRDMLQVSSNLWLEGFYAGVRRFADDNHVTWMIEPYFALTIDWRTVASKADIAGSEFWVNDNVTPEDSIIKDLFGPAPDTSELYGKNIVWAEAFTANAYCSAWRNDPWVLKPYGDNAFCHGVNHFVMHGFTHNPWGDNLKPGLSFGLWGTQFSRNLTWWPYSSAWHRYLARCQFLLSQGQPVSDVLAYPPKVEHIPGPVLDCAPYKQVVCNDETLLKRLSVKDGRLSLPHGVSYAALAIPPAKPFAQRSMTPEALKRIRDLVKEGATLIGEPVPAKSVSMQNYPDCDKEMAGLVAEIWGDARTPSSGERSLGRGRVFWGRPVAEVLRSVAGGPDFAGDVPTLMQKLKKPRYDFFHRRTPEAEIYFVANLSEQPLDMTATFRVTGREPQLWDAVTGRMRALPQYSEADRHTAVPMRFAPQQSFFVIFSRAAHGEPSKARVNFPPVKPVAPVEGPWQVAFDPRWGGPHQIEFATLDDWTLRPEPGIKYYSGIATYRKAFDAPQLAAMAKAAVYLDLGKVKNVARVRLNGRDLGIVWCAPWRVEVGGVLKAKGNRIEIEVVNTWVNRIIGDEQEPLDVEMVKVDDPRKGGYAAGLYGTGLKDLPDWLIKGEPRPSKGRYTFVNWQFYTKDAPLLESGLLGPVQIVRID
jgi:hypothetical protein